MKQILGAFRRTSFGTLAALFLLSIVGVALPTRDAHAAGLLYRSLQLSSSAPGNVTPVGAGESTVVSPGDAVNGQKVTHTYIFQVPTNGTDIKALSFKYCDDPFGYAGSCGSVKGFSAANAPNASVSVSTSADLVAGTFNWGAPVTFTAQNKTLNSVEVVSASGVNPGSAAGTDFIKVVFTADATNFFRNPDNDYLNNVTGNNSPSFFARVTTFSSDTSLTAGNVIDEGTVTSSVANTISINTRVQETLKFSVGGNGGNTGLANGAANDPTGTCVALDTDPGTNGLTEGQLTMGDTNQALSDTVESKTKSYIRLATNSARGAKVLYAGETLTSTNGDTIDALSAPTASDAVSGGEQFGLTVLPNDNNTGNTVYEDYFDLAPVADYNNSTLYKFDINSKTTPVVLAQSGGVVSCDTVPIEYVANITNETEAGLYSTKISYIAVPSY